MEGQHKQQSVNHKFVITSAPSVGTGHALDNIFNHCNTLYGKDEPAIYVHFAVIQICIKMYDLIMQKEILKITQFMV